MGGGPSSGLEFGQLSHLAIAQRATGPDACECLCGAIEIRQRHVLLQFPCVTKTKPLSRPWREFNAARFEELWTLFYASQSNSIDVCGRVRVRARVQCSQGHRQYNREKNDKHSVVSHSLLSDGFGRAVARRVGFSPPKQRCAAPWWAEAHPTPTQRSVRTPYARPGTAVLPKIPSTIRELPSQSNVRYACPRVTKFAPA